METDLYRLFEKTVKEYCMLNRYEEVVIGVSGGADSVCLLLLMHRYVKKHGGAICAVHIHHGIRKEAADADEYFVQMLCKRFEIPCITKRFDVPAEAAARKESLEEAGRRIRYEALREIASEKSRIIAVAHHLEDNAETVLHNLVRGSALKGLCGMQPVSRVENYRILRPLLFATRAQIEAYLQEHYIRYCEDETNEDVSYTRNALRLQVFPELEKINAQAMQHITEAAQHISEAEAFLEHETTKLELQAVSYTPTAELSILSLTAAEPVIAKRVIYRVLCQVAGQSKDLESKHVRSVLNLCTSQSGRWAALPYGMKAIRQYDFILILREDETEQNLPGQSGCAESDEQQRDRIIRKDEIPEEGLSVPLGDGQQLNLSVVPVTEENRASFIEKNQYTKAFDYDKIVDVIKVGARAHGDRIFLQNGQKTIKKFFTDEKIPIMDRNRILLLKDAESVFWIVGSRISEWHKISDQTTTALVAVIKGSEEAHED